MFNDVIKRFAYWKFTTTNHTKSKKRVTLKKQHTHAWNFLSDSFVFLIDLSLYFHVMCIWRSTKENHSMKLLNGYFLSSRVLVHNNTLIFNISYRKRLTCTHTHTQKEYCFVFIFIDIYKSCQYWKWIKRNTKSIFLFIYIFEKYVIWALKIFLFDFSVPYEMYHHK